MPSKQTTPKHQAAPPKQRETTLSTPFTNGQQAILQLLNRSLTDNQLNDIQQLIQRYLAGQTDKIGKESWQEKGYDQADMDRLLTVHMHTPYMT